MIAFVPLAIALVNVNIIKYIFFNTVFIFSIIDSFSLIFIFEFDSNISSSFSLLFIWYKSCEKYWFGDEEIKNEIMNKYIPSNKKPLCHYKLYN